MPTGVEGWASLLQPSMEDDVSPTITTSPPAAAVHQEAPAHADPSLHQSLLFSDSLKDLKNLRSQLYSAAEYFELSYTNDEKNQIVVSTLKDYAVKALINAVDHLGSVSYKVDGLVSDQVDEVSRTELRVSCIEQRIQTCQDYVDWEGRTQQSLVITAPKYHKRYILPGEYMSESTKQASPTNQKLNKRTEDNEAEEFQNAVHSTISERPPPSSRKMRSPSPSPRTRSLSPRKVRYPSPSPRLSHVDTTEKRSVSPLRASSPFTRSGSLSCKPNARSSSFGKQYPSETKKSASVRLPERNDRQDTGQNSSKGRGFLKSLLSRRQTRDDEMLYTYLDEY